MGSGWSRMNARTEKEERKRNEEGRRTIEEPRENGKSHRRRHRGKRNANIRGIFNFIGCLAKDTCHIDADMHGVLQAVEVLVNLPSARYALHGILLVAAPAACERNLTEKIHTQSNSRTVQLLAKTPPIWVCFQSLRVCAPLLVPRISGTETTGRPLASELAVLGTVRVLNRSPIIPALSRARKPVKDAEILANLSSCTTTKPFATINSIRCRRGSLSFGCL